MTGKKRTPGERKCIFCGNYFEPNYRSRNKQYVCKRAKCQKERRRLSTAKYRKREAMERKAREKVFKGDGRSGPRRDILTNIDWDYVCNRLGPEAKIILEEVVKRLVKSSEKKLSPDSR